MTNERNEKLSIVNEVNTVGLFSECNDNDDVDNDGISHNSVHRAHCSYHFTMSNKRIDKRDIRRLLRVFCAIWKRKQSTKYGISFFSYFQFFKLINYRRRMESEKKQAKRRRKKSIEFHSHGGLREAHGRTHSKDKEQWEGNTNPSNTTNA